MPAIPDAMVPVGVRLPRAGRGMTLDEARQNIGAGVVYEPSSGALAREMCVWGNPGGILAARGDHT